MGGGLNEGGRDGGVDVTTYVSRKLKGLWRYYRGPRSQEVLGVGG